MQKSLLFILCIICTIKLNSQEIISSSGDYFENDQASVSFTVGEPLTETFTDGSTIITQGFQQSKLTVTSIFELIDSDFNITIAPNPTTDFVKLLVNRPGQLNYQLFDFNGKLLKQDKIESEETWISFSSYAYAAYFIKIFEADKLIKTFQIIKQ